MTGPDRVGSAAMTAAEFRIAREMLGVSGEWLASRLGVTERQVRRWEAGTSPVPDGVAGEVGDLLDEQVAFVESIVSELRETGPDGAGQTWVTTYPSDAAYEAEHPGTPWPSGWHRTAMGLVADELDFVRVTYVGRGEAE